MNAKTRSEQSGFGCLLPGDGLAGALGAGEGRFKSTLTLFSFCTSVVAPVQLALWSVRGKPLLRMLQAKSAYRRAKDWFTSRP